MVGTSSKRSDGSVHHCSLQSAVSGAEQRACMQAADVKMGAINIRSEEGVTPEAVLAGFSRAEQEEVRSLQLDSLPFGKHLVIMYAYMDSTAEQSINASASAPEAA